MKTMKRRIAINIMKMNMKIIMMLKIMKNNEGDNSNDYDDSKK